MRQIYAYMFMSILPLVAQAENPMRTDVLCGQVLVTCNINERPMLMMLDTGASHTVLHKANASSLPNLEKPDKSQVKPVGNAKKTPDVVLVSVSVAGKSMEKQMVLVMDLKHLHAAMKEKVDGILGMDVLRQLDFTLDFAGGVFHWGAPEQTDGLEELPGRYNEHGCYETELTIDEKKHVFLLDTGCSRSVMKTADWPYEKENECAVQVADINTAKDQEMADGCPTDVSWTEHATLKGFSPMLSSACPRALIGVDSLKSFKLVHKAANPNQPQGQFLIQQVNK